MTERKPGAVIPEPGLTLKSLLVSEPWGEAWRATHDTHGEVIAALYCGTDGPRLFAANGNRLEVWKRMAASVPIMAPVLASGADGPMPFILIADGGGATLRELAEGKPMDVRRSGAMALDILRALTALSMDTILPIGLSPDRIVESAKGSKEWRILPIALAESTNPPSTGCGPYLPDEATRVPNPEDTHADLYSITILWIQCMTGRFDQIPNAATAAKATPLAGLATMWRTNLTPTRGAYPEPRLAAMVLDKYLHKGPLDADEKANTQAQRDAALPLWQQKLKENRRIILQASLALLSIALLFSAFFVLPKMFQVRTSDKNPRGAANLYFQALMERDTAAALRLAQGEAEMQTSRILEDMDSMRERGLVSPFRNAEPLRMGDASTNPIQAKTTLRGEANDRIMEVELVLTRGDDGRWRITKLFYAPLVSEETEAPDATP